jgi:hypothetical protein
MIVERPANIERRFTEGREKEHRLLEGSQASHVHPSDKTRVKTKLGLLK